ncbi:MAG TPA: tetratricopeptide repeat protein [Azospirillum sp.]
MSPAEIYAQAVKAHLSGASAAAEALCEQVAAQDPAHVGALYMMGVIGHASGRSERARRLLRRAAAIVPADGRPYAHLGLALAALGKPDEAVAAFRRASRLSGDAPWIRRKLGELLLRRQRPADAAAALRTAVCLMPDDHLATSRLAQALAMVRADEEAGRAYRRAIALDPGDAGSALALGHVLLRNGRLGEAYVCYERRFEMPGYPVQRPVFAVPEWDGAPLAGRTLLLYAERDFGDTLQHLRFANSVPKAGGRIVVECQPELAALAAGMPAVDAVVVQGGTRPPFDAHAAIAALPRFLDPAVETLGAGVPYLTAAPRRDLVPAVPGVLSVGLVWAGRPGANRACPLGALAPLLEVEGASFHALQVGEAAAQIGALPRPERLRDLAPFIHGFADTAGIMAVLDLVVTIDTAAVHLAGALGRPTWLLLGTPGAYRWQMAGPTTPWYPTVRLFRQPAPGDWEGLGRRVANALAKVLAGRRAA